MKKVKNFLDYYGEKGVKLYLKYFYRWQLRFKLAQDINSDYAYRTKLSKYWGKYNVKIIPGWHEWYSSVNGLKDVRYIPEDLFYCNILPHYNRLDLGKAYADKTLYSLWFSNVNMPKTIVKNMSGIFYNDSFQPLSFTEAINNCSKYKRLIIKGSIESGSGRNIEIISAQSSEEMKTNIKNTLLMFKKDYVIQEIIEQHETLEKLNPSSVNTIRITTFLHNGKVTALTSHLRIGNENSIYDHYGIVCGIHEDGRLQDFAIRYKQGQVINEHPKGYKFEDIVVPGFRKIKEITEKEHMKFGHFKIMSWDFAINKDGEPILVEFNLRYQGLNHHQLTIGPIFGDLTDEVLEEVFGRR